MDAEVVGRYASKGFLYNCEFISPIGLSGVVVGNASCLFTQWATYCLQQIVFLSVCDESAKACFVT